jgi:isoleucyl-tRNA synthetase
MPFKDVPQDVKFPEEEEKTLKYWDDIDAFQESLR